MSKIREILQYRGYTLQNNDNYKLFYNKDTKDKLIVFHCTDNLNIQLLKLYLNIINEISYTHAIIIVSKKLHHLVIKF